MPLPTPVPNNLPKSPVAMLLDFDGVIVDSVQLKINAFLTVYENEAPEKLAQVLAYQRLHGGVTRRVKFGHFERHLFGRSGDAAAVEELSAAYTALVHDAVLACPFVRGAEAFLRSAHDRIDLHVVSGTPQEELVDIIQRRGLSGYFRSVHGAPATKPEAFARILAQYHYAAGRTLAVGDAPTEYFAAVELGIAFLGVVADGEPNPFPGDVPIVPTLETLGERVAVV